MAPTQGETFIETVPGLPNDDVQRNCASVFTVCTVIRQAIMAGTLMIDLKLI